MRVLLDTNIFIEREDNKVLHDDIQNLLKLLNDIGGILLVHPKSIGEVSNDKDENRRNIVLSKIKSYTILESPPNPSNDKNFEVYFGTINQISDAHELNDLILLYAVYRNAVEFLITEDKGIHAKANKIGVSHRVFTIIDAITAIKDLIKPQKEVYSPPAILKKPLHNLKLEDQFFDELRKDYGSKEFNNWFSKKAKDGKEAYVYLNSDGSLGAFFMLKDESEEIFSKPERLPKKIRLKISTLKVSNVGNKLGELFLSISFNYAIKNSIDELYLTHFIKENDHLVPLIEKFGFEKNSNYIEYNHTENKESIFIKSLFPKGKLSINNIREKFFPCYYDGEGVNKFLVPIRPEYHERLFIDSQGRQTRINEFLGEFIVEGNTIQKAYLCNTPSTQMRKNDILIFYRTSKRQAVTSVGTIDAVYYRLKNVDEIINYVAKRTVYSKLEIETFSNPLTIILFRFPFHLPNEISYEELVSKGILRGPPQTIIKLNHKAYVRLKRLTKIDDRFTKWSLQEMP